MDDLVGRQIGNYRVEALLGKGGMGAVYSGLHRFFGERVAIKVLHGRYADDPVIAERFFREAQAARDIDHPSIITVKDFGQTDDGCLYLVMELLSGKTLGELLELGTMGEQTAALVAAYIAEALAAAHAKNVVHRDLKPDNIFIVDGRIKLLDFGIAKVERAGKLTDTGAMMGTPRYMSPEQVRGAKDLGPRSDLFSLGVILFEMVTGRRPYLAESVDVFVAILTESPPVPSTLADVSPEMDALILQLMEKDPAARPASALEVRERLARWAPIHAGDTLPKPIPALQALTRSGASEPSGPADALALPPLGSLALSPRRASEVQPAVAPSTNSQQPLMTGVRPPRRGSGGAMAFAAFAGLLAVGAVALLVVRRGAAESADPPAPVPAAVVREPTPPAPPPPAPPAPTTTPAASPAPAADPAAPTRARIAVRSDPDGAEIVDAAGVVIGHTPDVIEVSLPFKFTLRRDGYLPLNDVFVRPEEAGRVLHLNKVPTRLVPALPRAPEPVLKSLD